jgi:galactokinase/mevalonate kinase-like predicted kinase
VKTVQGGGQAMEKYFEYYRGGKVVNPMTGKVIYVKP